MTELSSFLIKWGAEEVGPRRLVIRVEKDKLRDAVKELVSADEMIYLSTMSAVDYPEKGVIELNYFFWSVTEKKGIIIRVEVPRDEPEIDTITDILPGANNAELEAHDLLGVVFKGNRSLRRGFLLPPEIVEAGIYPLRKDAKGV